MPPIPTSLRRRIDVSPAGGALTLIHASPAAAASLSTDLAFSSWRITRSGWSDRRSSPCSAATRCPPVHVPGRLDGEQAATEAVVDHPSKLVGLRRGRDVDHRAQGRRAGDAADGRQVLLGDVVVVDDHLEPTVEHSLGEAPVRVDEEVVVGIEAHGLSFSSGKRKASPVREAEEASASIDGGAARRRERTAPGRAAFTPAARARGRPHCDTGACRRAGGSRSGGRTQMPGR